MTKAHRWRFPLAAMTIALVASMTAPLGASTAAAAAADVDGGLVISGSGYAEPLRHTDAFNALAGRDVVEVAHGYERTCAVDSEGGAACWGQPVSALGIGRTNVFSDTKLPARVRLDESGVLRSRPSTWVPCTPAALTVPGRALCWGGDNAGQLGNGAEVGARVFPDRVDVSHLPSDLRWADLSTGGGHTCALTELGRAYCWGLSFDGQLGLGDQDSAVRPQPVLDGDLDGRPLVAISAGITHTCAIDGDGRLYCWGNGARGRLGLADTDDQRVPRLVPGTGPGGFVMTAVTKGARHTCGVTDDERLVCWGYNRRHQVSSDSANVMPLTVVPGLAVAQATTGTGYTCAVDTGGVAWCWGLNAHGQLGIKSRQDAETPRPVRTDGVLAGRQLASVHGGIGNTVAVDTTGVVYRWGGQPPPRVVPALAEPLDGAALTSVDGQGYGVCVTDTGDRIMCAETPYNDFNEIRTTRLGAAVNARSVSAGDQRFCVLDVAGSAYCWGWNLDGFLGIERNDRAPLSQPAAGHCGRSLVGRPACDASPWDERTRAHWTLMVSRTAGAKAREVDWALARTTTPSNPERSIRAVRLTAYG